MFQHRPTVWYNRDSQKQKHLTVEHFNYLQLDTLTTSSWTPQLPLVGRLNYL